MKRFYKLLGIVVLIAAAIGLVGCPNDNNDTGGNNNNGGNGGLDGSGNDNGNGGSVERDSALFGTWDETYQAMTFNSDGSFIFIGFMDTPPNAVWSTSNGVISLDFPGMTDPNTASYSFSSDGNTLTTRDCTSGFLGNSNPSDEPMVFTKRN
jgi:hypothetical protein